MVMYDATRRWAYEKYAWGIVVRKLRILTVFLDIFRILWYNNVSLKQIDKEGYILTKLLNLPVLGWNIVELKALSAELITAKSTFGYTEAWLVKCIILSFRQRSRIKRTDRQVVKNTNAVWLHNQSRQKILGKKGSN